MKIIHQDKGLTKRFELTGNEAGELLKKAIAKYYKDQFDNGSYGARVEWELSTNSVNVIFYKK